MGSVGEVHIRRGSDHSVARRPLRLEIGRRRAQTRGGDEKFVTQVRIGEATAVVVPWRQRRS
jgi:hypothetical protein